ncbi:hypothetical protein CEXT_303231 [Caerostris extrusa]|uniref:Uncharacterized protein n=1 Tax=Caerostris extrusa TaxID=172846 RepID=A0AAV4WDI3_CAEEX|nr:hypothetical protein CEXT_303231 [Caerostris extrusa]
MHNDESTAPPTGLCDMHNQIKLHSVYTFLIFSSSLWIKQIHSIKGLTSLVWGGWKGVVAAWNVDRFEPTFSDQIRPDIPFGALNRCRVRLRPEGSCQILIFCGRGLKSNVCRNVF